MSSCLTNDIFQTHNWEYLILRKLTFALSYYWLFVDNYSAENPAGRILFGGRKFGAGFGYRHQLTKWVLIYGLCRQLWYTKHTKTILIIFSSTITALTSPTGAHVKVNGVWQVFNWQLGEQKIFIFADMFNYPKLSPVAVTSLSIQPAI